MFLSADFFALALAFRRGGCDPMVAGWLAAATFFPVLIRFLPDLWGVAIRGGAGFGVTYCLLLGAAIWTLEPFGAYWPHGGYVFFLLFSEGRCAARWWRRR